MLEQAACIASMHALKHACRVSCVHVVLLELAAVSTPVLDLFSLVVSAGGGSPETEVALQLTHWAKTLSGMHAVCVKAFAEALEIIPYTLAENAGMNPIAIGAS